MSLVNQDGKKAANHNCYDSDEEERPEQPKKKGLKAAGAIGTSPRCAGAGRRGSKKKTPKSDKAQPTREPSRESKRTSEPEDDEECEEYDDEDDMETLIGTLSGKLQFHVFNPDKYEISTHKNIIIVPDDHRKTSERMTEYEWTEVVSHRAKQIENGSSVFANVGDLDDPIKMAEEEIKQKKCPLSIRRMHNDIIAEVWGVNEMEAP